MNNPVIDAIDYVNHAVLGLRPGDSIANLVKARNILEDAIESGKYDDQQKGVLRTSLKKVKDNFPNVDDYDEKGNFIGVSMMEAYASSGGL